MAALDDGILQTRGDGFEDEELFCHDQAEGTYLIQ